MNIHRQGARLSFDVQGDGPAVILGHSMLCSREMWALQVVSLSRRFKVINVDIRGHGESGSIEEPVSLYDLVDDFVAVLDHLEIDRAAWAGLSIGGMVAMRAALVVPDRVSALVLLNTDAGSAGLFTKIEYTAMGWVARVAGLRPLLPTIVRLMFGRTFRARNPALVEEWKPRFAAVHLPSVRRLLTALNRRDSALPRLGDIMVPSLVLTGSEDTALSPKLSRRMAEALPSSRLITLKHTGHLSCLEQPEAVTAAMMEFLAS
jgi:pimeloyl-ACP methyl ester carboxylesterase